MRATKLLVLAVVAVGLPGCNPSSFNSLTDQAPVAQFAPSGSSTDSLFVLPLPMPAEPGTTSAARMLVSDKNNGSLTVADYDMNGKVTLTEASATDRANLGGYSVYSAAARPDGVTMMLGTPNYGGSDNPGGAVSLMSLIANGTGGYTFAIQPGVQGGGHLGIAVAAGNVTGAGVGANFVAVGDATVEVFGGVDGKQIVATSAAGCTTLLSTTASTYASRPLAVGDLLAGGYEEIALASPGKVVLIQWDGTATLPCPAKPLTMGASVTFGTSVAVADFDGDGRPDLAVGNPPDKVYVFFGPLGPMIDAMIATGVTTPSVTITSVSTTGFGQAIAAYHLPGQIGSQLLVADPGGTVGGHVGKVMLFNVTGAKPLLGDADALTTLFNSNGDATPGVFGYGLGGLVFNTGLCVPGAAVQLVPWATSAIDVLTFFNYPAATADPRCFSLRP
jgi:hypothetical protein